MWCPRCGAEYRPGFTECYDCGVPLVEELPEPGAPEPLGPLVEVWRGQGHMQGELVRSVLRGSGIEATLVGEGEATDAAYKLSVGPLADVRVLVTEEDEARARELLAVTEEPDFSDEADWDDQEPQVFLGRWRYGMALIALILAIAIFLTYGDVV